MYFYNNSLISRAHSIAGVLQQCKMNKISDTTLHQVGIGNNVIFNSLEMFMSITLNKNFAKTMI